jgi:hypothetical protein
MARQAITLELPESVYERVKRTARGMQQPVEQALVRIVTAAMPSLEHVPSAYHGELEAMEALSDAELRRAVESQIPVAQQRQLTQLQRKHQRDTLTERERQTLARLRMELGRVTLRRSYAYLLLKCHGHRIPTLTELKQG